MRFSLPRPINKLPVRF